MISKKKLNPFILLLLSLFLFPQAGITAENSGLRDIAIADLSNISDNTNLDGYGRPIAEMIFTELARAQKLSLVERSRLEDAINEIALSDVGITNAQTAAKIGRAVSARHIFVGTLSEFKQEGAIVINTRLIEVESGRVVDGWSERSTEDNLSQVAARIADQIIKRLFPGSPASAALKSTILPGWGQLSNGHSSGYLFLVGGLASAGGLVGTQLSLSSAEDDRDELEKLAFSNSIVTAEERRDIDEAGEDVDDKRKQRNTAAIVLGAVWGLNIIDAYVETSLLAKSRRQAVQRTLTFEATPNLQGIVMRVRF